MVPTVFPMYVGVILTGTPNRVRGERIPHVCGGDPPAGFDRKKWYRYSPCMWG